MNIPSIIKLPERHGESSIAGADLDNFEGSIALDFMGILAKTPGETHVTPEISTADVNYIPETGKTLPVAAAASPDTGKSLPPTPKTAGTGQHLPQTGPAADQHIAGQVESEISPRESTVQNLLRPDCRLVRRRSFLVPLRLHFRWVLPRSRLIDCLPTQRLQVF